MNTMMTLLRQCHVPHQQSMGVAVTFNAIDRLCKARKEDIVMASSSRSQYALVTEWRGKECSNLRLSVINFSYIDSAQSAIQ